MEISNAKPLGAGATQTLQAAGYKNLNELQTYYNETAEQLAKKLG